MEGVVLVALIGVGIGVWWWLGRGGGASHGTETQLRRICLGDSAQMEHLIDAEMTRRPGISRAEAVRRAVLRYERDNR